MERSGTDSFVLDSTPNMKARSISIVGTRGIPAGHGGFETFAERLALYLTSRGWSVTVYCQGTDKDTEQFEDVWQGVHRVVIPVSRSGALGTMEFDWKSISDVLRRRPDVVLTLGYNTASFCLRLRISGLVNLINMDGLEWRRKKWKFHQKAWLWLNERLGCWVGNRLIADHPVIAEHLATRVERDKVTMIPYGADRIADVPLAPLEDFGLDGVRYGLVIARPEPENSVLEIVAAFSRKSRDTKLVVLGKFDSENNEYHRQVLNAASDEVIFPGAIYDSVTLQALRKHAYFYAHGHRVGGTNPSLVEAMGAGSAIVAHDNAFNRWVAGQGGRYFASESDCDMLISALLDDAVTIEQMRKASADRYESEFRWSAILAQYEALLERYVDLVHAKGTRQRNGAAFREPRSSAINK